MGGFLFLLYGERKEGEQGKPSVLSPRTKLSLLVFQGRLAEGETTSVCSLRRREEKKQGHDLTVGEGSENLSNSWTARRQGRKEFDHHQHFT